MNPRQFVKAFRDETGKHLAVWHETLKADFPIANLTTEEFISLAAKKKTSKNYIVRALHNIYVGHRKFEGHDVLEFTIDGAQYRILNKPTALAYAYKHASRAI